MRKVFVIVAVLSFSLAACNGAEEQIRTISESKPSVSSVIKEEPEEIPQKDFEGDYEEMGKGTFTIYTPSGSSENGEIPFLFINQEEMVLDSIGYEAFDFDGSHLTYIYVDGVEQDKTQLKDTSSSVYLSNSNEKGKIYDGNPLQEGIHDVEVVQFDNDKPDGEVIFYRKLQYEIKAE